MDPNQQFLAERDSRITANGMNASLLRESQKFMIESIKAGYSYNFDWLSRPIIQYPQDIVALQQLIWSVKPDLIIETGIAHGGSLILSASLLALLDYCEAAEMGVSLDPKNPHRKVLGIDIDIRSHNRSAIEKHPMASRISMIQGSSVSSEIINQVRDIAKGYQRVFLCLDSNHTHDHVLAELEAYAPLTSFGSYCVVFDTVVEDFPKDMVLDRPWGKSNNPKTAVHEYLRRLSSEGRKDANGASIQFEIDKKIEQQLLISVAPDGYLRRVL